MMLGGPARRCVVLMNQSSQDHTLQDVRPSPEPGRGAVSHQSSRDKRAKRSLPGSTVRREGRAISVPAILAAVVGDPTAAGLPRDTPLLSGGLALDSVTVVRLLAEIRAATGVDVADLDLDLDALATIGTLTDFVTAHAGTA